MVSWHLAGTRAGLTFEDMSICSRVKHGFGKMDIESERIGFPETKAPKMMFRMARSTSVFVLLRDEFHAPRKQGFKPHSLASLLQITRLHAKNHWRDRYEHQTLSVSKPDAMDDLYDE